MKFNFSVLFLFLSLYVHGQCPSDNAMIYKSSSPFICLDSIAQIAAPMFWFSPDEPNLYDEDRRIQLPQTLPFDQKSVQPIVYYKIRKVYTQNKESTLKSSDNSLMRCIELDLNELLAIEIEYYLYYEEETGLGGHPHDLESVQLQIKVHKTLACKDGKYALEVKRVIARAHGLYWFENALNVDELTTFPISILVEEGKHANCTDKNADGVYTPGYDVTEKVNDAWGIRDIISTGRLFSGGFQAWMAKVRTAQSILLPPKYLGTSSFVEIRERFPNFEFDNVYAIRPFPVLPENYPDKKLRKMVESKKPEVWPTVNTSVKPGKNFFKLSKENKLRNKVGFTYRWDDGSGLSISTPLLFVKHVEAPMTGGWFYHKFYFSDIRNKAKLNYERIFGHQIQYTQSASRWLDSYIGLGYEIADLTPNDLEVESKTFLASEIGIKIRVNITKTPLKFLKFLGTDYWGIRVGWKNLGFNPFTSSGFVVEFGAGAF